MTLARFYILMISSGAVAGAICADATFGETLADRHAKERNPTQDVVIRGQVRDERGSKLQGVSVDAVMLSHRRKDDPLAGSTVATVVGQDTTDEQGKFRLSIRKSTSRDIALEVSAGKKGSGTALFDLDLDKPVPGLEVRLPDPKHMPLRVLAPTGEPLPNAKLRIVRLLGNYPGADAPAWFTTPDKGVAAWPAMDATSVDGHTAIDVSEYVVEVELEIDDERVARERWIVACHTASQPVILRTEPMRRVTGEVISRIDQTPLAGAVVRLTSWQHDRFVGNMSATTDARGHFMLRPYVGDQLEIRVTADRTNNVPLSRRIPWLVDTRTQRMVLPMHDEHNAPEDGTTPDGRRATTIEADYPEVEVAQTVPTHNLTQAVDGTLVLVATLTVKEGSGWGEVKGLIAVNPTTGNWKRLAEGGHEPRVSPSGEYVICNSDLSATNQLQLISLRSPVSPALRIENSSKVGGWMPGSERFLVNAISQKPQVYYGQVYWPVQFEKHCVDRSGTVVRTLDLPEKYVANDVSRDGKLVALHWDTHASQSGAQLYVASLETNQLTTIARKRYQYYWYPRFNPDGNWIVAKHLDANKGDVSIRLLSLDGSSEHSISFGSDYLPEIGCWSPDGTCLAVVAYQREAFEGGIKLSKLFLVDRKGYRFREVTLQNVDDMIVESVDWTAAMLVPTR